MRQLERKRKREPGRWQEREIETRLEVVRSNKNFKLPKMYYIDRYISGGLLSKNKTKNEDNIILTIKK